MPANVAKAAENVPMKRAGKVVIRFVVEAWICSDRHASCVAEPEEIAQAVLFMVSDKASYVCGANLRVGGGRQ